MAEVELEERADEVDDVAERVGAVAVVEPRRTVDWSPEEEIVVVRVLELPDVLTRLFTVVDGVLEVVVVVFVPEVEAEAVLEVDEDDVAEPVREVDDVLPDVPETDVEAVLDVDVDVEDEVPPAVPEAVLTSELVPVRVADEDDVVVEPERLDAVVLRVAVEVEAEAVRTAAELAAERVAVEVVLVTVDSDWMARTSLALAADLVTIAVEVALACVAVRTGRLALRTLKERSGYCFS